MLNWNGSTDQERDTVMRTRMITAAVCAAGVGALAASPAMAQSAGDEAEIALLKRQLRLLEQRLDKLEKHGAANAKAAVTANAKARVAVTTTDAEIPTKAATLPIETAAPSGVVVTMPNNRPTICTADEQNCISLTSRLNFD